MGRGAVFCSFVLVAACGMAWRAYVATVLWRWFVVPLFALQPLPLAGALGLIVLVALAGPDPLKHQAEETRPMAKVLGAMVVSAFARPLAALLLGAWVAVFM